MSGPLTTVAEAIASGAQSRRDLADRTGLDPSVVDAAIDHLIRLGRLTTEQLGSGCPDSGCGSCGSGKSDGTAGCGASGSGKSDGTAGCGASGPANARGPVLLQLTHRPT